MSTHAFLAPSAAALTVHCAAAPALQARYPEPEGEEAREGNAAHWVLAQAVANPSPPALGAMTPQGLPVTQEMLDGAQMVVAELKATLGDTWRDVACERRVISPTLHATHNWGTPDVYASRRQSPTTRTVYLRDYKFGHGIIEVYENWQCIDYAAHILHEMGIVDLAGTTVDICIIQPRAFHPDGPVRHWRLPASQLVPYWDKLRAAYYAAMLPEPVATPGTWCGDQYCSARRACTALQRSSYFAAQSAYRGVTYDLSPHDTGIELRILHEAKAVLDARIEGLEQQALSMLQRGDSVPWWTVARTKPRRAWTKEPGQVIALGNLLGLNLAKPPEAITPTQARDLGVPLEVLDEFSKYPPGSPVLKPDSVLQISRIFNKG